MAKNRPGKEKRKQKGVFSKHKRNERKENKYPTSVQMYESK